MRPPCDDQAVNSPDSFVQLASESTSEERLNRVADLLQRAAASSGVPALSLLAMRAQLDTFAEVKAPSSAGVPVRCVACLRPVFDIDFRGVWRRQPPSRGVWWAAAPQTKAVCLEGGRPQGRAGFLWGGSPQGRTSHRPQTGPGPGPASGAAY